MIGVYHDNNPRTKRFESTGCVHLVKLLLGLPHVHYRSDPKAHTLLCHPPGFVCWLQTHFPIANLVTKRLCNRWSRGSGAPLIPPTDLLRKRCNLRWMDRMHRSWPMAKQVRARRIPCAAGVCGKPRKRAAGESL